ncbi:Gfo/Idh/MocA family oxidoreductase [Aquibacillus koreensis]|uniref:Gfo/Idh/MocA family oxidoreductase n=1 Tax=Aquibacillus koreensis TaxID=279446 RepID=A0A9X3WGR8_9BACI|nr:Gfo/Idh/MocA family oxidoreductase [Aquibacillus koreensis]MCT2534797.1 Gfo/Idh/MocA family oxidoreductase [Aquibacillus koreensis]MDC3419592.1 Gfo/Idh/MocA family oxidoreductase [Aquibacillus koreensis]
MTNKIYRVGIVGAGNVTRMHLDGLKKNKDKVDVVAICDPNLEVLNERADAYDIENRFTSLSEFIAKANVDVAVVCTPSAIRKEILFPLIEAGIPIFCEKPFCETLEEAEEITEKAKKHGVPISIDQNFRTHFSFDFVKKLIAENEIGSVSSVRFHDYFFRQDQGWRTQRERNSMSVMGIHWFDGFRWILGSEAKSLVCQTYSSPAVECAGDTDSTVQILFQNGVPVTYTQSLSSAYNSTQLVVVGETGTLLADYTNVSLYRRGSKEPVTTWKFPTGGPELKPDTAFEGLRQLFESMETGVTALNSSEDNLKTISLLEAAYQSAKEQRIVFFNEDGTLKKSEYLELS